MAFPPYFFGLYTLDPLEGVSRGVTYSKIFQGGESARILSLGGGSDPLELPIPHLC